MIDQGCSACACGVKGACDVLYFPSYAIPGAILILLLVLISIILIKKRVVKAKLRTIFAAWAIIVLLFAGLVWARTESQGDRTARDAEYCRTAAPTNISCEY